MPFAMPKIKWSQLNPISLLRRRPRIEHNNGAGYTPPTSDPPSTTQSGTTNVILFGETGVGKGSVINLIAQEHVAKVSSDVNGGTMESTPYKTSFDGTNFTIFDTVGLDEPEMEANDGITPIEKAFKLIIELEAASGIHLLLFCMRGGRITATMLNNYRMLYGYLCDRQIPIALVFTCLEREENMEDWWTRNESRIAFYGIQSQGHACITAVHNGTPGQLAKYEESQKKIRHLIRSYALTRVAMPEPRSWPGRFATWIMGFLKVRNHPGSAKKKLLKALIQCHLAPDIAERIVDMMGKSNPRQNGNVTEESENSQGEGTPGQIVEMTKRGGTVVNAPNDDGDLSKSQSGSSQGAGATSSVTTALDGNTSDHSKTHSPRPNGVTMKNPPRHDNSSGHHATASNPQGSAMLRNPTDGQRHDLLERQKSKSQAVIPIRMTNATKVPQIQLPKKKGSGGD